MREKYLKSIAAALALICAVSILSVPKNDARAKSKPITYSNMVSKNTKNKVSKILIKNKVSKKQTVKYFKWVNDLYKRSSKLKAKEFIKTDGKAVNYDNFTFKSKKLKNGDFAPEVNCRMSAFLLYKNLVKTKGKANYNDTFMMFDVDAIENAPQFKMTKNDKKKYTILFNSVNVKGTKTLKQHRQKILKSFKTKNTKFKKNNISLISLYMHSPSDNLRFIGHTGVLIKNNKSLLFLEKFGPEAPYQITKFNSKKQLINYLLSRKDIYGDKTELSPIITQNNKIIYGGK